ncbi:MAG: thioredoxin family protein [Planctomycetes bacterium]|nr:thioredoxin family protein [Planctomycetota bacterium]
MNRQRSSLLITHLGKSSVLCTLLMWSSALVPPAQAAPPKVTVTPYASVTAVQPGQPFEVAFQFDIEKAWHTYWKNAGDAGLPPEVDWQLPAGFETTALEHPVPKRHESPGDIITYIHEDQPILTTTLTPPADLEPGTQVELKGEMLLLVCKVQCIRMTKPFSLSLPVVDSDAKAAPANEKVFASARRRFPQSLSEAKYITIKPVVSVDKIRPKDKFKLAVVINVEKGNHIQSHTPLSAGFIATEVFLEPTNRVELSRPQFPKHKVRSLPGNLKVAEYGGRVVVRFDGVAEDSLAGESVRFAGVVRYQACNDKGQCYRPQNIHWEIEVPVGKEGDAVQPASKNYFGAAAPTEKAPDGAAEKADTALAGGSRAPIGAEGFASKNLTGLARKPEDTAAPDVEQPNAEKAESERADDEPAEAQAGSASDGQTPLGGSASSGGLEEFLRRFGIAGLLVACFLYGLILNATPCVLPLLSIKVLGFVQQAHESRRRTLALGVSFGIGVILFFVVLGFLAAAGNNVLQFPVVVIGLGAVVMALALSMLGVYTLKAPDAAAALDARIGQEGIATSFGKGMLAPVLGFACTGPLLVGAFTWATQQPPSTALLAFLFMGLGMASPYVLLGAYPNWLSFLPKPGNWMITFERVMGFMLLGMVVWLIHPLVTQIGAEGLEWTLAFFVAIGFGCWLWGKITMTMTAAARWSYRGGAIAVIALAASVIYGHFYQIGPAIEAQAELRLALLGGTSKVKKWNDHVPWELWSPEAVEQAVRKGKVVFVDFTAGYCTTCKLNKKFAIDTPEVRAKMEACGVVALQADFSMGDEAIFEELKKHGRVAVPMDLIYRPDRPNDPIVLEVSLSKKYLLEQLALSCSSTDGLVSGL